VLLIGEASSPCDWEEKVGKRSQEETEIISFDACHESVLVLKSKTFRWGDDLYGAKRVKGRRDGGGVALETKGEIATTTTTTAAAAARAHRKRGIHDGQAYMGPLGRLARVCPSNKYPPFLFRVMMMCELDWPDCVQVFVCMSLALEDVRFYQEKETVWDIWKWSKEMTSARACAKIMRP
jgi:hypothetical protein